MPAGERVGEAAAAGCAVPAPERLSHDGSEEDPADPSLSTRTMRRRIADGALRAFRVGPRSIRVRPEHLEQLLRPIPSARSWR